MPRLTARQQALKAAKKLYGLLLVLNVAEDDEDNDDDSVSSDSTLEDLLLVAYINLNSLEQSRYFDRRPYRPSEYASSRFSADLHTGSADANGMEIVPWLNDVEFLRKYRMQRDAFWRLHQLIKDDEIFLPNPGNGRIQRPTSFQLIVCLKAFGKEGSGLSAGNLRDVFATGHGTSIVYICRVVTAIRKHRNKYLHWPDEDEKKLIAHRINSTCGLPNCVGMVDGTLFPLSFKPKRQDHADFKGRKHGYSLSGIFVNNDKRFIRYYAAGWPGSTHDIRIAGNTKLWKAPQDYFAPNEYIIGDSAFEVNWFILPAFSCPAGATMSDEHTLFNKHLSKARVTSEHTIGLLKGRFPWLRSIRKTVAEDRKTLKDILLCLDACVILHNFLLEIKMEEYEEDWLDDDDDSVLDDVQRRPSGTDELNLPVPNNRPADYRRTQVLYYLQELYGM